MRILLQSICFARASFFIEVICGRTAVADGLALLEQAVARTTDIPREELQRLGVDHVMHLSHLARHQDQGSDTERFEYCFHAV